MGEHSLTGAVRPRALVFDVLGDHVRHDGGEIRLKVLVALGEELGVPGPTMRVTVARMREQGWLSVRREGRESVYGITPTCLRTLDDGRRRIFRAPRGPWPRTWSMVIATVPESDRRTREQLRTALAWEGFGPLAPATWVCPHPRTAEVAAVAAALPTARLELLTTTTADLAADRAVAARCWDLGALEHDYRGFVRDLRRRLPQLRRDDLDGAAAMAARIALVQAYRRFPFRDPDLPGELQPPRWPGDQAHALFTEAHALLGPPARAHYRDVVGHGASGSGPPPP